MDSTVGAPSKLYQRLVPLTLLPGALPLDKALVRTLDYSVVNRIYAKASGMAERRCLLMTTLHWKTGEPRTVVLPYSRFGDRYVVVGSLAGAPKDPVWVSNIRQHPTTWLRVGGQRVFCRAHVAEGEEREQLWQEISADGSYRGYAKRARPRLLPLVVHEPVDAREVTKPPIDRVPE